MSSSINWNLGKSPKVFASMAISVLVAYVVPRFFSPAMETLVLVSTEKHFLYSLWFGFSFLVIGEMTGIFEQKLRSFQCLAKQLII